MAEVVNKVKALNQQALALMRDNDLDAADDLLHSAQRVITNSGYAQAPEVIGVKITTLNNQGCSFKRRGQHMKAVSCFETAMSLERHIGAQISPTTLINLSTALTAMGDADRAVAVAADCVALVPKTDLPMRTIALHNLAVARFCAGDRSAAVTIMKKAYKIALEALGEGHSTTLQIRNRLYEWTPQQQAKSARAAGAASSSRQPVVFAPAPPPTARQAAARALRSLDFGTPDLPPTPPGGSADAAPVVAGYDARPDTSGSLPPRDRVMAGATFSASGTPGGAAGLPDKLPPIGTIVAASSSSGAVPADVEPLGRTMDDASRTSLPAVVTPTQSSTAGDGGAPSSAVTAAVSPQPTSTTPHGAALEPRRKKGEPLPPAHGFCRFATDALTKKPPTKITFADVKRELRHAEEHAEDDDETPVNTRTKASPANPFAARAAKKDKRVDLESAEERAFLARRAKQEEIDARERERQHKSLLIALARRNGAARLIQYRYRLWRAQNKAMLDMKRQQEQKDSVSRAKSVTGFAQRWLSRTAGKRLVARMHTQSNFGVIDDAVRRIQRAFRGHHARVVRARLEQEKAAVAEALAAPERRAFACVVVQTWYRRRRAEWELRFLRQRKYLNYCLAIQRWIRSVFGKRRSILSEKHVERMRNNAATRIQAMWRGASARFRCSMLRFQRKVQHMRTHERNTVKSLQRYCRGALWRFRLGRYRRQLAEEHREFIENARRTEPPSIVGVERMSSSKHPPTLTPLRVMPASEAIEAAEQHRQVELDVAIKPMREAAQRQFDPGLSRRDVELKRAAEMHRRSQEGMGMRRMRSAVVIQRALRRYFKSQTFGERERFKAKRNAVAAEHVQAKSAAEAEAYGRAQRRTTNDLARDIREEKEGLKRELDTIPQPPAYVYEARSIAERQEAAVALKKLEDDLARQLEREKEELRQREVRMRAVPPTPPPVEPTTAQQQMFLTLKQRKAAAAAAERAGSAESAASAA